MISLDNFFRAYVELLEMLVYDGKNVGNTHELTNVQFTVDSNHPIAYYRKPSLSYMLAELVWYFSADNSKDFIGYFADMWNHISDDGKTSNSAYGYIIHKKHGFDQIKKVIELLKKDPESRRALININVPNEKVIETKDEMCTIALQFLIRNERLDMTAMMRSNDVWFGLPYDIVYFTAVQKYIANELGLESGSYTHFVTSMHIYKKEIQSAIDVLDNYYKIENHKDDALRISKDYNIDYLYLIEKAEHLRERIIKEVIDKKEKKSKILEIMREEEILV